MFTIIKHSVLILISSFPFSSGVSSWTAPLPDIALHTIDQGLAIDAAGAPPNGPNTAPSVPSWHIRERTD